MPDFYPRSPCGERLGALWVLSTQIRISIHALLAESDRAKSGQPRLPRNFYPRSPCGERPDLLIVTVALDGFLSTLSLRRATFCKIDTRGCKKTFLSTLSLRRATGSWLARLAPCAHFYPRSPCGERLTLFFDYAHPGCHFYPRSPCGERPILS